MSSLVLSTVMDAIGAAVGTATGIERVYTRPTEAIRPTCVVVGYPEDDIDFDVTYQNGLSHAVFPVWAVLGIQQDATTHTQLSSLLTFGVLDAIAADTTLLALGSVFASGARIEGWNLGTDALPLVHTAARFTVEVTA